MPLKCHSGRGLLQPDAVPLVQQRGRQAQSGDLVPALPAAAAPQRPRLARVRAPRRRRQRGRLHTR